jgi:hypothetical protein
MATIHKLSDCHSRPLLLPGLNAFQFAKAANEASARIKVIHEHRVDDDYFEWPDGAQQAWGVFGH